MPGMKGKKDGPYKYKSTMTKKGKVHKGKTGKKKK